MGKTKIDKETAVKSILKLLKAGTDKKSIWKKLERNGTVPKVTFYRWYNEADVEYQKFLVVANPIVRAKEIEALGEIAVSNILSKLERQQLLSDIARGDKKIWKEAATITGIVQLESYDPLRYIAELNKMDGAYLNDIETDNDITEITIRTIDGS